MGMKRASILILSVLLSGISVFAGVESNGVAIVAGSSADATAAGSSAEASGEVSAVLFGEETPDVLPSAESPSTRLRLSHETAETHVVIGLNASESTSPSGKIVLYEWDFDGDGVYDAATGSPTVAHVFDEDGTYGVRVLATDDRGAKSESEIVELVILNRDPVAGFAVSSTSRNDTATYGFHDDSADLDGKIVGRSWNFGDGAVSNAPDPVHAYADDGTYSVTLVVIDEDGAESTPAVQTLVVGNTDPVANFAVDVGALPVNEPVSFVDESVDPSPNGSIVHVAWDFGDGSYRAGSPSEDGVYAHTYMAMGTYTVTLYVIDDDGGMSSVQQRIFVA